MPKGWTKKDERKYEHIKESAEDQGKSEKRAKEIAARTVNKHRQNENRTSNETSQGTGNPNSRLEDRTVQELRVLAKQRDIANRSRMNKKELIEALRNSA